MLSRLVPSSPCHVFIPMPSKFHLSSRLVHSTFLSVLPKSISDLELQLELYLLSSLVVDHRSVVTPSLPDFPERILNNYVNSGQLDLKLRHSTQAEAEVPLWQSPALRVLEAGNLSSHSLPFPLQGCPSHSLH